MSVAQDPLISKEIPVEIRTGPKRVLDPARHPSDQIQNLVKILPEEA